MTDTSDLYKADIRSLSALLHTREISARELTDYFLGRIDALNPQLNAVLTVTADAALVAADAADAVLQRGEGTVLTGIPLLHKDVFCTRDVRTTCGSRMLAEFHPPYDATVVSKLAAAGMISLGKCNMDEFAMGSSNENSYFGPAYNPWDTRCVPGGSSGGSAAAVAAGLAPVATGTDTGGSIRQPAAFCGITGIKPTYGRVSRLGMVAFASSLDQAGPMAGSVADCALMLSAMAGMDPQDSTSVDVPVPDFTQALGQSVDGLRIGLPREYFNAHLDPRVAERIHSALHELEQAGAKLVEIDLPLTQQAIATYYVIAPAEASTNLSRYDGVRFGYRCENPKDLNDLYLRSRSEGFGDEVKRRILVGTYALSAGYY
ncbi:MAG: amidase family protein, partial [Halieaceae bacterium]|nr:amidase family protein [Halieaceae bacterium]